MAEFDDEVESEAQEEPEAPRPSKLFQHYLAVYNDPADYMRADPHRKHRDEFNDVTNWIPSEQNQPYDTGRQDEYGNPIMGSRYNDALMSRFDDTPVNSNKSVVDLAAGWVQSTRQEGGDPLQQLSEVNVGTAVSGFASRLISDKFKESKLYADYFYGADEKRQAIAHATELFSQGLINVDPASLGNVSTEQQRKIWANMMEQVRFVEKLQNLKDIPGTTDENGKVDMRKVLAQFPEIRDVLNEKGTNAAVLALMEAKHIKKIDEVYSNEFTRFFGAVGTGLQRGFNNLGKQVVGAKAAFSAMLGNRPKEAFTQDEKEYLDMLNRLNDELPENSYTGVGSAVGGILGSALENAPLVLTAILGAQAGGAAAVAAGASAPVAATVGATVSVGLMGLEIGGSQYEQNVNKRDKEGRRMYTPGQAAYLSMTQGLAEGVLEQYTLKQMGNAIMGRPALKELTALYSSEAARDLALVAGKGVGEAELKAQTAALVEQTLKDMANAGVVSFKTELFEEFTQQVSDMVIENAYQLALKGEKAELSSMQDILVESIGAAAEAVPAVIGFGVFGAAGHGAMHRRQLFSPRQYINDLHTEMAQTILNNQHLIETIESVGNNLENLSELQGKAPEVVQQILDSNNERYGIKASVIDIKALKQEEGGQTILDEIAKRANISEDELAACEAGTGLLTVDTSFLMQVSSTAEDAGKKALFRNVTKEGILKTNAMAEAEIEEMKKVAAILEGKADIDQEAAIEKYAKGMLKDNEQVQRAMDILRADIEHPHAELKKRLKDIQAEIDAELDSTITGLKAGMKQGVDIVQNDEGGVRVSNNAPWYQNFFADNGRAPTKAELEQIAYENATGQATRYADMDMSYDGSPEEQQYFAETKAKLDALFKEREALQELEPNLRWVQPGDVIAASTLTAEGVNVYRQVKETLLQGNKEVAASAAASALLFARQAERAAKMHQEAGETNYTAEDYLMGIVANAQTADQSLAQMQSQMEAVRRQYEGTAQWMKAPNGQPTKLTEKQWLQVRTPAFKAWFGDWENDPEHASKVVDENGEPLVVYHGTAAKDIEIFEHKKAQDKIGRKHGLGWGKGKFYFIDSESAAMMAARNAAERKDGSEPKAIPVFLNIRKMMDHDEYSQRFHDKTGRYPYTSYDADYGMKQRDKDLSAQDKEIRKEGYDGLVSSKTYKNKYDGYGQIAVFNPNQIKSAVDNNGNFSLTDDNIYYQITNTNLDLNKKMTPLDITKFVPADANDISKKDLQIMLQELAEQETVIKSFDNLVNASFSKGEYAKHVAFSSYKNKKTDAVQRASVLNIKELLGASVLVESFPANEKHSKVHLTHRMYVPVQVGNKVWPVRIVLHEMNETKGRKPIECKVYDLIVKKGTDVYHDSKKLGSSPTSAPSPITIREMLSKVNGNDGIKYINTDGTGNFSTDILAQRANDDNTLVGVHNLSEANLRHALKMGGLANPSMAIVDTSKQALESYGEITLIAPTSLVDKTSGRNAGTYAADIYSPRYPDIDVEISDKDMEKMKQRLREILKTNNVSVIAENIKDHASDLTRSSKLKKVFIAEKYGELEEDAYYYIRDNNLRQEFEEYAAHFLDGYDVKERIFNGFTPSGRRKYLDHTLENVSKYMKKQGRQAAEGFSYGLGSFRALLAPKATSTKQIKKWKDRLQDKESFTKAKEELEEDFKRFVEIASDGNSWDVGETRLAEAVQLKKDVPSYLESEYGVYMDEEDASAFRDFVKKVSEMPTEYFETKFERPVSIGEFAGAIIPKDLPNDLKEVLRENVYYLYEYDREENRTEVLAKATKECNRQKTPRPQTAKKKAARRLLKYYRYSPFGIFHGRYFSSICSSLRLCSFGICSKIYIR